MGVEAALEGDVGPSLADFARLLDLSPNAYAVLDRNFCVRFANRELLNETGWTPEQVLGRRPWEVAGDAVRKALGEVSIGALSRVLARRQPETLTALRYDTPNEEGVLQERYWRVVYTPLVDSDTGEVRLILQHSIDVTGLLRVHSGELGAAAARAESLVFAQSQEIDRDNRILRAQKERLNQLFEQAPGFMCVLREPEHRIELVNRSLTALVGERPLLGLHVMEAVPEMVEQGLIGLLDRVFVSGRPYIGREVRAKFARVPGEPLEELFLDVVLQPICDADGQVSGIFVEGSDVTDRVQAQRQQRLLLDELNHRVKNTLSTVQSIATQTLRSTDTAADFCRDFEARLIALSKTHDLLTQGHWRGADIRRLLEHELQPFDLGRVVLEGPRVTLPPRAALTLGLVFHELATNAAKYGALSTTAGQLTVRWSSRRINRHRQVELEWVESNGPEVKPPKHRGFGSKLIERSLASEGGVARLEFAPQGLRASLSLSVTAAAVNHRA
jgi:PAS domain S-box-containing protein